METVHAHPTDARTAKRHRPLDFPPLFVGVPLMDFHVQAAARVDGEDGRAEDASRSPGLERIGTIVVHAREATCLRWDLSTGATVRIARRAPRLERTCLDLTELDSLTRPPLTPSAAVPAR